MVLARRDVFVRDIAMIVLLAVHLINRTLLHLLVPAPAPFPTVLRHRGLNGQKSLEFRGDLLSLQRVQHSTHQERHRPLSPACRLQ